MSGSRLADGLDARNVVRLGLPYRFVDHAELLADLGLDVGGICRAVRQARGVERDAWSEGVAK